MSALVADVRAGGAAVPPSGADGALPGEVTQELPNPAQFTDLVKVVTEDQVAEAIPCGPDPAVHLAKIREYVEAGFDHVYLHQVGPDQRGFIEFAERELLPALAPTAAAVGA